MRGLCQLSARWHQQFFRTAKLTGHQQCLQQLQPLPFARLYRQGARSKRGELKPTTIKRDVEVREYDQLGSDPSTRTLADPRTNIRYDEEALVAKINQLQKELDIMKEGPFGPNSELIQAVPKEYRSQVLKELEEAGLTGGEDLLQDPQLDRLLQEDNFDEEAEQETESGSVLRQPAVTLRIPRRQKEYVKRLNRAVDNVAKNEEKITAHLVLWQWYLRCQQHVANFSAVVPEDVWQVLWKSVLKRAYRPKHVIVLAKDMQAADIDLHEDQKIAYIDALLAEDDAAQALICWKEEQDRFDQQSSLASKYWSLGVRLYAALGRPMKAQEIAFEAVADGVVTDGTLLLSVISAWATSSSSNAPAEIWSCYLRLRTLMNERMSVQLYQKVSSALLHSGHADMALAVFKDMLISQEKTADDSTAIYHQAVTHLKDLQSRAITEEQINRIGLSALIIFPKRFQNKFFFGSWIKMLIGRRDIDGAAAVVELMYERAVKLDAKHLNGMVGAWLREGSAESRKKAVDLAWSMINARIEMVKRRKADMDGLPVPNPTTSTTIQPVEDQIRKIPVFLRRASPPANIETFSILLLHYMRRLDATKAEEVTQIMTGPAEMRPDSFILNHWLYNALRASDIQGVWDKYSSLKYEIKPDLTTFAALWDTAKVQYDKLRVAKAMNFPSARLLFAEMTEWLNSLNEKQLDLACANFSKDLYQTIIRSFELSLDTRGLLCAMHGMKTHFGVYPDMNTTRIVMTHVSRTLPMSDSERPVGARHRKTRLKSTMKMLGEILEAVADQRKVSLMQEGVDLDKLENSSKVSKQAQLDILSDFILTLLERQRKRDGNVENEIGMVAKDMKIDVASIDFATHERNREFHEVD